MNDCFKVVKIDQNGKEIDYRNDMTAYQANIMVRELNKSLKLSNPKKIRKYTIRKEVLE